MNNRLLAPAVALVLLASIAWAQTTYKSTMPDGKVVYGEKPEPGAKQVDKIAAPPAKAGVTVITPAEKARAQQKPPPAAAATEAKQRELEAARKQLQQAEAALEAGKEPLPGERLGLKGGGSRLTDDYFTRQKGLEGAVEAAKKRVEAAEQALR